MTFYLLLDTALNSAMPSIENSFLTWFSLLIEVIFDSITLTIISLLIATYLFLRHKEKKGIFLLVVMFISGLIIMISKNLFARERPINAIVESATYAFPSGHATIIVVFLGLLVYLFSSKKNIKKMSFIAGFLMLFVGFTRIYLRVHWLTDVIAGFVLGGLILWASIFVYEKFIQNLSHET